MKNVTKKSISMLLALCMAATMMLGIGTVSAGAEEVSELNYSLSYGTEGDYLPEGWTGNTEAFVSLGGWAYNTNVSSNNNWWNKDAVVIQEENYWKDSLEYTIRMNESGATDTSGATAYFFYNDRSNYYAMEFGSKEASGIRLVKKVNGTETVLATAENFFQMKGHTATIKHTSDGTISVTYHAENSSTEVPFFDDVVDTTFDGGYIGFGIRGGGGWFSAINAKGTIVKEAPPQTNNQFENIYSEDFTNISDEEAAKWVNYGHEQGGADLSINKETGKIGGADWGNRAIMAYTGQKMSGTYRFGVDLGQNWGGAASNWGGIVFNYQAGFKGYTVEVGGGSDGTIALKKYTGNLWNGVETLATYEDTTFVNKADLRLEVTYEEGGYITVVAIKGGNETVIFDQFYDASYTSGYIGVSKQSSAFVFDNISIDRAKAAEDIDVDLGTPYKFTVTDSAVARPVGRTQENGKEFELYFPVTGIEFMVQDATQVELTARIQNVWGGGAPVESYLGVYIDDSTSYQKYKLTSVPQQIAIAKFAEPGTHKIRVAKLNGPQYPCYIKDLVAYSFVDGDAAEVFATLPKSRKIEIIGDSITVGEAVTDASYAESDKSYATLTGNYFDADTNIVAIGGGGFVSSNDADDYSIDGDMYALNTYHYYNKVACWTKDSKYDWDFSKFTPDIIVTNIGTNGGDKCTKEQYIQLINQIRSSYGDTETKAIPIIMALGPMNQFAWPALSAAADELVANGDTNIYKVQLGEWKTHGGALHPNESEQRETADLLIAKIKEVMPQWNDAVLNISAVRPENGNLTVYYNSMKHAVSTENDNVYCAVYDENGRLVKMEKTSISFDPRTINVNGSVEISADGLDTSKEYQVKMFIWNSNIYPKSNSASADSISF